VANAQKQMPAHVRARSSQSVS